MLLVLIFHREPIACDLLHLFLHPIDIAARLQLHLYGGDHLGIVEQPAGKTEGCEDVVGIVLVLPHEEGEAWGMQVFTVERSGGIGDIDMHIALRGIDLQRIYKL